SAPAAGSPPGLRSTASRSRRRSRPPSPTPASSTSRSSPRRSPEPRLRTSPPAVPEEVRLPARIRHGDAHARQISSLQGPSCSPWGECRRMSGTGPEEAAGWLPGRVLVLGLARSGQAAALALARRGVHVVAADRSADVETGRLADAGVEVRAGSEEEALLEGVELVVKSPGVPAESPLAAAARARGVPVWSEVELGYRLLPGNPLVGVTGTNGKTTTTELLGAIFRAAGRDVEVAGNVGRPLTTVAEGISPGATVVCELSSFQLEDVHELALDVAVLLNLEPDHLDRHGTFEA